MNFVVTSLSWAGWVWTAVFFTVAVIVLAKRQRGGAEDIGAGEELD